jgi:peptide/nickel transport system substrate-binding protein
MGILPKHLWENVHPENFGTHSLNTNPIGSGPFLVKSIKMNKDDTVDYYELQAFKDYALGEPFIDAIIIKFFANEDDMIAAYKDGSVTNINSIDPKKALALSGDHRVERIYLPRIFSAFFNQNEAKIFSKKEVRQAMDVSVSREQIVNEVLYGYATEISGPIPPGSLGYVHDDALEGSGDGIQNAIAILENAGWTKGDDGVFTKKDGKDTLRLSFSISTTKEAPELYAIAEILKKRWEEVGASVTIKTFETKEDLKNLAIRPRKYDVLLFGEIIGVDADPYAFWHSSQRLDPGLNIASYTNINVDAVLEKGRKTTDLGTRIEQYKTFQEEIKKDVPAVFLYAPQLIYATNDSIQGMEFSVVNAPGERLANVHTWFLKTERVWKIFAKNKLVLNG